MYFVAQVNYGGFLFIQATSKNCFASDLWNFARKISTFF